MPVPQKELLIISELKGTLFIIITTILLFLLIRYFTGKLEEKNKKLEESNREILAREYELRLQNDTLLLHDAEWEATYDAISDWICLLSPNGKILKTNRGSERLFNLPPEKAINLLCHDVVHNLSGSIESCPRLRTLQSKKRETMEVFSPNNELWLQITTDPVFNRSGEVVSIVHIVHDISERMQEQKAFDQAKKKLHLLNYVTFNEIQNNIFTLWGFQQFIRDKVKEDPSVKPVIEKEEDILRDVTQTLKFAQAYQNLGLKPPLWQDVNQTFLLAISHLDFLSLKHTNNLDNLEIFADPLFEQVLLILAENTLIHGKNVTEVKLWYTKEDNGLKVIYEDNGIGIPLEKKKQIFTPDFQKTKTIGLFLAKEILEITDIKIQETGIPGSGARFELFIPKEAYSFAKK